MSGFSLGNVMIYSGVELAVKSESGGKLKILEEFEFCGCVFDICGFECFLLRCFGTMVVTEICAFLTKRNTGPSKIGQSS